MKVGIFCEESQVICKAFRKQGHEAYSFDLQDCSGGHPEWHIKGDILNYIDIYFDLIVFHPTCRYITNSGVRWLYKEEGRWDKLDDACDFFNLRHQFNSPRVATENPIPHKHAVAKIGKYDQLTQPWQFGHKESKATCFWLKGLPRLKPTKVVGPPPKKMTAKEKASWNKVHYMSPGPEREKLRSKTYSGIAKAISKQWIG